MCYVVFLQNFAVAGGEAHTIHWILCRKLRSARPMRIVKGRLFSLNLRKRITDVYCLYISFLQKKSKFDTELQFKESCSIFGSSSLKRHWCRAFRPAIFSRRESCTIFCEKKSRWCGLCKTIRHTYLAQGKPWSSRRFPQEEALPLHFGWADTCDNPKCGLLGCAIYLCGGLRSR